MNQPTDYLYMFWHENLTSAEPQQVLFAMVLSSLPSARFTKKNSFIRC